jgi:hypothetical protein
LLASRLFDETGPSSYKKNNLPGRGLTKVEKHCVRRITGLYSSGNSWYLLKVNTEFIYKLCDENTELFGITAT